MKYKEIEKLYNTLDSYLNSVELTPEYDELLNKLTKLSEILDNLDAEIINKKEKELLNDLENKEINKLIVQSISDINNLSNNINKFVYNFDKILSKLSIFI